LLGNYNDTLYSYFESTELKEAYVSLSTFVFEQTNSTSNSTIGISQVFESFVNGKNDTNSTEFLSECMESKPLPISLGENFQSWYCTILAYAGKFTIDPYDVLDKAKLGISFIFKLIFGTIVMEIIVISKAAIDYMLNFYLFCFCVFYMLQAKQDFVSGVISIIPMNQEM